MLYYKIIFCIHWIILDDDEEGCFCDAEEESSSSDSELDIEFTPPAGIIHPER